MAFVPETAVLYKYWGSRTLGRLLGREFLARVLGAVMVREHGDPTMADYMYREAEITHAARQKPELTACANVLAAFNAMPVRYVGEKSPNNSLFIKDVLALSGKNAEAKLILIRRDPFDQIASSVRTSHIGGGVIAALSRHYVYQRALEGVDVHQVAYEALVQTPELILREICTYLDIPFQTEMLQPGVLDSSEGSNFFQRGDFGFIPDSIGKGRKKLGIAAVAQIEAFLAEGPRSLPWKDRVKFWWGVSMLEKNRLAARMGIVMLKTVVKARLLGRSAAAVKGSGD